MANLNYDYHFPKKSKPTIDEINQYFPYKSFKVFFDKENYLFTEYRNVVDYSAVAILESYDETVLIVDSCNCGYGGYGPNNTIALLKLIGVSEETAAEYVKLSQLNYKLQESIAELETENVQLNARLEEVLDINEGLVIKCNGSIDRIRSMENQPEVTSEFDDEFGL